MKWKTMVLTIWILVCGTVSCVAHAQSPVVSLIVSTYYDSRIARTGYFSTGPAASYNH